MKYFVLCLGFVTANSTVEVYWHAENFVLAVKAEWSGKGHLFSDWGRDA